MIRVDHISKVYRGFKAVDDISFQVDKGEILGFLGPNGAGKSTTMKMITGFIKPTSGTAFVGDHNILTESIKAREIIGYLPENAPSYKGMTVVEFLTFIAEIRGYRKSEKIKRVNRVIELTSLGEVRDLTIDILSKGFKQRVGFSQALIHDPPILILDEPTDGLDPNQKHEVRNLIKNMAEEKVIILSTHILDEMEAVCSRAIIINKGKIVADSTPEKLKSLSKIHHAVTIGFHNEVNDEIISLIKKIENVKEIKSFSKDKDQVQRFLRVYPKVETNILSEVSDCLIRNKISVEELHLEKGQLDEVFRHLTMES